jgi:hypothetical protein
MRTRSLIRGPAGRLSESCRFHAPTDRGETPDQFGADIKTQRGAVCNCFNHRPRDRTAAGCRASLPRGDPLTRAPGGRFRSAMVQDHRRDELDPSKSRPHDRPLTPATQSAGYVGTCQSVAMIAGESYDPETGELLLGTNAVEVPRRSSPPPARAPSQAQDSARRSCAPPRPRDRSGRSLCRQQRHAKWPVRRLQCSK